jgi:hypothetical protein
MFRGHPLEKIDDYPWRTINAYLAIEPLLDARGSVGGIPDDSG